MRPARRAQTAPKPRNLGALSMNCSGRSRTSLCPGMGSRAADNQWQAQSLRGIRRLLAGVCPGKIDRCLLTFREAKEDLVPPSRIERGLSDPQEPKPHSQCKRENNRGGAENDIEYRLILCSACNAFGDCKRNQSRNACANCAYPIKPVFVHSRSSCNGPRRR